MSNLANIPPAEKEPNLRGTALEAKYFKWLCEPMIGQCCVTGSPFFELCHTAKLGQGRGMAYKGPLNCILPLRRELHSLEESRRDVFWRYIGLPDYREYADNLFKHFTDRMDPTDLFTDMQELCDRERVADLLTSGWPE